MSATRRTTQEELCALGEQLRESSVHYSRRDWVFFMGKVGVGLSLARLFFFFYSVNFSIFDFREMEENLEGNSI